MPYKTSERRIIIKLYDRDNSFIRNLDEAIGNVTVKKEVGRGSGKVDIVLNVPFDELPDDIDYNNKIKVYFRNKHNADPTLVYYGYIISINPKITGDEEQSEITCLGAVSKLKNDFLRGPWTNAGKVGYLAYEIEDADIDGHIQEILNDYRDSINTTYGSYDYSMIDDPANYWSDTSYIEDTAGMGKIPYRYFNMKYLEAIQEISKFLNKNPDGDFWYWYMNDEGRFILKKLSSTADHTLYIDKHISNLEMRKNIENLINRVYFWNERGSYGDRVLMTKEDTTTQDKFDVVADRISDSEVSTREQGNLLASAKLNQNKEKKAQIAITVSDANYDILSFKPGQVVNIRNLKDADLIPDLLVIRTIQLSPGQADLELALPQPDLTTQIQTDREYIDKQMKWFGNILARIDSSRLEPGALHWITEDFEFSPGDAGGSNQNKQISWNGGTFELPNGVHRVVAGTTDTNSVGESSVMDTSKDYRLYIDEKQVYCGYDKSLTSEESGTGDVKAGENFLYDSSKSWNKDQWKGYAVWVDVGTGGEKHIISESYADNLKVESYDPFDEDGDSVSYEIHKLVLRETHDRGTDSFKLNGSADSGTTTTLTDTDLSTGVSNDGFWNGYEVKFRSGDNMGLTRTVSGFDLSADQISWDRALPNSVSGGDAFELYLNPESQFVVATGVPDTDSNKTVDIQAEADVGNKGSTAQEGGKYAWDGLDSGGQVKQIIDTDKIVYGAKTQGLNITSNSMGYYDGAAWKSYIDKDGKFQFKGNTTNSIDWDITTSNTLTIKGSIEVQGGNAVIWDSGTSKVQQPDGATNIDGDNVDDGSTHKFAAEAGADITNSHTANDTDNVNGTAASTIDQGASRANSGLNSNNRLQTAAIPSDALSPGSSGLYLGGSYMGYHDGSSWQAYIASNGDFKFSGDATHYIEWDASAGTLDIRGSINANDINAGTVSASYIEVAGGTTFGTGYDPTTKTDEVGGTYETSGSYPYFRIFPTSNIGFDLYDSGGSRMMVAWVDGTYEGDVIIGDYGANNGVKWDNSASTFYIRGELNADDIIAGTLTSRRIRTDAPGNDRCEFRESSASSYGDALVFVNSSNTAVCAVDNISNAVRIQAGLDATTGSYTFDASSLECPGELQLDGRILIPNGWDLESPNRTTASERPLQINESGADYNEAVTNWDQHPYNDNEGAVGTYDNSYDRGYFWDLYTDDGTVTQWQNHDDIQMIKDIGTKETEERTTESKGPEDSKSESWDLSGLPDEIEKGGKVSHGALNGLLIGTLKQLIDRVEKLEEKVES